MAVLNRAAEDQQLVRQAGRLAELVDADLARPPMPSPFEASRPVAFLCAEYGVHVLAADLLGRPRRARRRPAQGGVRPGAAAGRGRADVPQRLLPPADRRRRLAARVLGRHRPGAPARRRSSPATTASRSRSRVPIGDVRRHRADLARATSAACRCSCSTPTARRTRRLDRWITGRLYDRRPRHAPRAVRAARRRRRPRAARRSGIEPGVSTSTRATRRSSPLELAARRQRRLARMTRSLALASGRCSPPTRPCRPATTPTRRTRSRRVVGRLAGELGCSPQETRHARPGPTPTTRGRAVRRHAVRAADEPRGERRSAAATARSRARCGTGCGPTRAVDDVPITSRHQRRAHPDLARPADVGAARPPPRRGLAGPRDRPRDLGARSTTIPAKELWASRAAAARRADRVRPPPRASPTASPATTPRHYAEAAARAFDPDVLTIGFARRLATYKRLDLLLQDPERRSRSRRRPARPGAARRQGAPARRWRQARSCRACSALQARARLRRTGRVPRRLRPAHRPPGSCAAATCGSTSRARRWRPAARSGMKYVVQRRPAAERARRLVGRGATTAPTAGRSPATSTQDHGAQDERDAATLHHLIADDVIPAFYEDRDDAGVPIRWTERIRASLRTLGPMFCATRMLNEYVEGPYRG